MLTRDEMNAAERDYWLRLTSVGQFLVVAVVLAVVVGVIFVYQMMAADIRNMLPEYATVKALGYRPPYLTGVVLWQAVLLAVFGYAPGLRRRAGTLLRGAQLRRHPHRHDVGGRARRAGADAAECASRPGFWPCGRSTPPTRPTCSRE